MQRSPDDDIIHWYYGRRPHFCGCFQNQGSDFLAEKEKNGEQSGLHLNKKTILGLLVILSAILIFAGVITQVVPRGEYYSYPDSTYRLKDGSVFTFAAADSVYEINGSEKVSRDEYLIKLAEYGVNVAVMEGSDREKDIKAIADNVSNSIIDGTYHEIDFRMPVWKIPASFILVFGSENIMTGIAIILFIVLIGGTFFVLDDRGILTYIMASVIKKFEKKKYFLICAMVFICMLLSSTAGILEESVTLVPIAVAVSLALGWDSLVGISISLVAVAFGFTAATFNPFNVITVQKLAGVPVFSGLWLRIITFALVYISLTAFIIAYAKKIEKDPSKSISRETDEEMRNKYKLDDTEAVLNDEGLKKATRAFVICIGLVLVCIVLDFAFSLSGSLSLPGMAILFTLGGLLAGYKTGLRGKDLANGFIKGVKTIAPAIPLIFFILAITYILDAGMIIHTILFKVYSLISGMSPFTAVLLLFGFVMLLEFFIGSSTAKAFLIMPIVAPLATLVGISGNTVVLSYCMADGFTNLLFPTSGIMIIAIGLVNVSYGKWLKYMWKLFLIEFAISVAILYFAISVGYA